MASEPTPDVARAAPHGSAPHVTAAPTRADAPRYSRAKYAALAEKTKAELEQNVLPFWFPKLVGAKTRGFIQNVKSDGETADDGKRFLVFQARLTWVAAEVARRYPEKRAEYLRYVEHGLDVLEHGLSDARAGGLHWEIDLHGKPTSNEKHVYGIAFGIYAAATAARVGEGERAKNLALKTFAWLDEKAHDAEHGGYYEALSLEGKPILTPPKGRENDAIGTAYGRKSMNTHIHVLEALTELYRVVPSEALKRRLTEVFELVRDRISDEAGFFHLYFAPDWTKFDGPESYGHDVEGAFLLLEAAEALGIPNDEKTRTVAKKLVDRALERGWDATLGGFYNEGEPSGRATDLRKVWWVQAEGLNGLLALHELYAAETRRYLDAFAAQWSFIEKYVSDRERGEWWGYLGPRGELEDPAQLKANQWKACYHDARALMVSAEKLEKLAADAL